MSIRCGPPSATGGAGGPNGTARSGSWRGEIWNKTKAGNIYPEWLAINTLRDEAGLVTHYIGIFDDVSEKKEYEKRLMHLANYDSLTELPNRHLMQIEVKTLLGIPVEQEKSAVEA